MRNAFCRALVEAANRPEFVFLTGDLGYRALEPLRDALGSRFINAGVAEQNMVSVAAGLARSTASLRSSTPGPLSRFATTSASTDFRSCWWATVAATATV
jgi:transketolase C-terminal domain/subunit